MKHVPQTFVSLVVGLLMASVLVPTWANKIDLKPVSGITTPVAPSPRTIGSVGSISQARTQRLPKGTLLKVSLTQTLDARQARIGDSFNAQLVDDVLGNDGSLILPRGTLFRGRLTNVTRSQWFAKGASIRLDFDQVTLPIGREQPIALVLQGVAGVTNTYGELYQDVGYNAKLTETADRAASLISDTTRAGYEAGKELGGPVLGAVFAPFSILGGGLGAAGLLGAKAVQYAVAPGQNVVVTPNTLLLAQLAVDTLLPVAD
ncbi:MAG: hypothetical protein ACKO34_00240 [Vampirovibrionales bacterium]